MDRQSTPSVDVIKLKVHFDSESFHLCDFDEQIRSINSIALLVSTVGAGLNRSASPSNE